MKKNPLINIVFTLHIIMSFSGALGQTRTGTPKRHGF